MKKMSQLPPTWHRKGEPTNHMKIIAIITLAAAALGLGACAKKDTGYQQTTTSSGSTSTYSGK